MKDPVLSLKDLGYSERLEQYREERNIEYTSIGRVIAEHKERYVVKTVNGEFEAEITGNMRFSAKGREDFPAVGDWVSMITYQHESAVIVQIFPRFSLLKRQAVGQFADIQIIAANVDLAFIVQAVDRDFNINRIERYLTICNAGHVQPIILLTKIDLIEEDQLNAMLEQLHTRHRHIPVLTVSNMTGKGYDALRPSIKIGKTYCLLGSSGVGKSSLVNNLSGRAIMRTDSISVSTSKGRHITSHRALIILENGGILIDNPGMREVGIADTTAGLETTFDSILKLANNCKFKDCTHTNEIGCHVIAAVEAGELDRAAYQNYLKMEKEKSYFESSVYEKRKKDRDFGKMVKQYKKGKNSHKQ